MGTDASATLWPDGVKPIFRFFCVYILLYTFPFPISTLPTTLDLDVNTALWHPLVVRVGEHLLKLETELSAGPGGSGDTAWHFVQVLLFGFLSLLGMIIWSALDRRRVNYEKLYYWLIVLVRYFLAITLIHYGFAKLIKTQFPEPLLDRLVQPLGDASPMGLLWTFMGYSTPYNFFTGVCEVLGGVLLFFGSTRMLGALISVAVLTNIVALNFSYDVPVKLFSMHLLAFSMFLLLPDVSRLRDFLLFNRSVPAAKHVHFLDQSPRYRRIFYGVKIVCIVALLISNVVDGLQQQRELTRMLVDVPLIGAYEAKLFVINRDTLPPLLDDTRRWKRLTISLKDWATIEYMDGARLYWHFQSDTLKHQVQLISFDSTSIYEFHYTQQEAIFFLEGKIFDDSVRVRLKRTLPEDFPLMNRGFHWINEVPYNR